MNSPIITPKGKLTHPHSVFELIRVILQIQYGSVKFAPNSRQNCKLCKKSS